jgi:16S rRNA (adenine1518-N6/adenine1519-N6)-dimethyltransferase
VSAGGLGARAIRDLAARHGIKPARSLGQHFLIDPNLARAIAADADVGPRDHVVEIGAGLGSLTVALAATGARVLAVEFDRRLIPALQESVAGLTGVRVHQADAMKIDWPRELGRGAWVACANLPYNVAVPLVLEMLEHAPAVKRFVVMVQREVGERLAAAPGTELYGAVSVRVAYRAHAALMRRVPADVFWPRPGVESIVVRLDRRSRPAVKVDPTRLWRVVDAGFAERRKTMRSALRRLGVGLEEAVAVLDRAGIGRNARAEALTLEELASIADEMPS